MDTPRDLRYTDTHEWVRLEDGIAVVGITDFAQSQMSDLTYVELPSPEDEVSRKDEIGVVESVKAASDIFAPFAGVITEVNEALIENPELINTDPYEQGWMFKMKPANPDDIDGLLDADQYDDLAPEE
ncbi:MAG: glycine cleavage system protein GcvH [Spartobacteria bacterium]|nr:glycine cleavage system protein GcvH [Spartobacteria bacterium]